MSNTTFWLVLAGVLVIAEMTTGTFYLLLIALGAALGAAVAWAGYSQEIQITAVALFSGVACFLLQNTRQKRGQSVPSEADSLDVGNLVEVSYWSEHGGCQVQYRGALWHARSVDNPGILGTHEIVAIKGNSLILKHVGSHETTSAPDADSIN